MITSLKVPDSAVRSHSRFRENETQTNPVSVS